MTAVLVTTFATSVFAQPANLEEMIVELRDRALEDDLAYELLRSLTVEVGHRFAGSPGDRAAVAWARRQLEELGFDEVRTEPVTVPHWVRGEASGRILVDPAPRETVLLALGGSVGTPEGGITAEVVRFDSLEALEAIADQHVRGKIVFIDRPTERTRTGRGYGEAAGVRRGGPAVAGAKGAAALLIRSIGTGNSRFAHTGSIRYSDDAPRIPAAALAIPDAEQLTALLARGPVRFHLELGSHYRPDTESANVIAEIRGRERPDEIVLLGAHLDSWDVGTGAHDDGAGCATVMSAARLIAELPEAPRRTIRVVLFANEEFGLSGARAYAEAHAGELDKHQLAIESDLGGDRVWAFATAIDPAALPDAERFAALLEPLGIEWLGNTGRGGADLIPLREARVPRADLWQEATRYFDFHHTIDDTFDKIDPEALAHNVAAYVAVAWWAAETETSFPPAPEPEPETPSGP